MVNMHVSFRKHRDEKKENHMLAYEILFPRAIITSTARASCLGFGRLCWHNFMYYLPKQALF